MIKNEKSVEIINANLLRELSKPINSDVFLFGEVNTKSSRDLIEDLLAVTNELLDNKIEDPYISVYVNTEGGDVYEMYAIQDTIDFIKKQGIIVQTIGIGQVMSAGLIILACGTKGQRFVGKKTRLMFHQISAGNSGTVDHIKTEFSEVEYLQNQYIDTIVDLSKKTKTFYKKLLDKKNNHYFTAEEAISWGIVDKLL